MPVHKTGSVHADVSVHQRIPWYQKGGKGEEKERGRGGDEAEEEKGSTRILSRLAVDG